MAKVDRDNPKHAWLWMPVKNKHLTLNYEHDYSMFKIDISDLNKKDEVELIDFKATAKRYIESHNRSISLLEMKLTHLEDRIERQIESIKRRQSYSTSTHEELRSAKAVLTSHRSKESALHAAILRIKKMNSWLERVKKKSDVLLKKKAADTNKNDKLEELKILREIEELKIIRAREEREHEAKTLAGLQEMAKTGGGNNE